MALRNYHGKSRWLSCGRDHQCKLSTCPGSEMSHNRDWIDCSDVMFNLHLVHYGFDTPVRSGDRVAACHYAAGYWLSCWPGKGVECWTSPCPGTWWDWPAIQRCRGEMFWIYSPKRQGSCSSDTTVSCRGKPIQKGDNVFIQYSIKNGKGWWLSEDDEDIRTRTCPGLHINDEDKRRCGSESWTIFAR